ncbi:hypothetical protein PR048_005376 [Dryococelus australis]|uniref:PiggyBac transposable element-derived protein domain-containing protein n=1 Tax=Dryococelus australis TaxID=614101 RepID=A0ABQ9I966_9NEOP|nr:hypothetical protein PR048_005376 [Dryococelus australis]
MKVLPSYHDYWSTKPDFHDYYISGLLTVNRFGWLLSHIHFNDNSVQPKRATNNTLGANLSKGGSKYRYCTTPLAPTYILKFTLESWKVKLKRVWLLVLCLAFAKELFARITICLLTIFLKHLPQLLDEKKMKRGEYDLRQADAGIVTFHWMDRKGVHLIYNYLDPRDVITIKREEKYDSISEIPCQKVLKDYNVYMCFVDNFDRLKNDYQVDRKSKKMVHAALFPFCRCSCHQCLHCPQAAGS